MKNCLLYTFRTPVGKIEDSDSTHSESITTPSKSKPWLIEGTENYKSAVAYMSKEGSSIDKVKLKYDMTKEVENKLLAV